MKKLFFILALLLSTSAILSACSVFETELQPTVVTSSYPLTYFTERIAGDLLRIHQITPSGVEPHDYFLEAKDLKEIQNAELTIALGGNFETWSEELYHGQLLEGAGLNLIFSHKLDLPSKEDEAFDPHLWLDPTLAQRMVQKITKELSEVAPQWSQEFSNNADLLIDELAALDQEIQRGLSECQQRKLIVTHNAFSYFAQHYALGVFPILNSADSNEPSLEQLKELVDFAKENGLIAIFLETLENPEVARVLAEEANLTPFVLNPLEGLTAEEESSGENYFSIMRSNLENLKMGLQCQ